MSVWGAGIGRDIQTTTVSTCDFRQENLSSQRKEPLITTRLIRLVRSLVLYSLSLLGAQRREM